MRSLSNPVSRSICDAAAAAMADERYCTRSVLPAGMMGWKRYVGMKERRGGGRERERINWMLDAFFSFPPLRQNRTERGDRDGLNRYWIEREIEGVQVCEAATQTERRFLAPVLSPLLPPPTFPMEIKL